MTWLWCRFCDIVQIFCTNLLVAVESTSDTVWEMFYFMIAAETTVAIEG